MAVFNSWMGKKAIEYRRIERITETEGHRRQRPGDGLRQHGRAPRAPASPSPATRTPARTSSTATTSSTPRARTSSPASGPPSRSAGSSHEMPKVYEQLMGIREKLEQHYKEMQDIEFTVQDGTLYMLQTRTGKRTGPAAVRIAVEMVKQGPDRREDRHPAGQPRQPEPPAPAPARPKAKTKADRLGHRRQPRRGLRQGRPLGRGRRRLRRGPPGRADPPRPQGDQPRGRRRDGTSPRASSPRPAARRATRRSSPEAGASPASSAARRSGHRREGRHRSRSPAGRQGGRLPHDQRHERRVMIGQVPTVDPEMTGDFATIMTWSDKYRTLKVRTNADTPEGRRRRPASSAPRGSASAGPSTCSSRASGSSPCGR